MVFWGGLDSCFGRWDINAHPLADLHSKIRDEIWLGQDYNDARIMDFSHVNKWKYNMLNRKEYNLFCFISNLLGVQGCRGMVIL